MNIINQTKNVHNSLIKKVLLCTKQEANQEPCTQGQPEFERFVYKGLRSDRIAISGEAVLAAVSEVVAEL